MKKEHVIKRQGKDFVLYEGLLDEAHQQGLKRISTTLIQVPSGDNEGVAIVHAEVETGKGSFSGLGDASPGNVNRMIVPHLIRMAETRAKARALRDAVNVGMTAFEELSDGDEAPAGVDAETGEITESRQQASGKPTATKGNVVDIRSPKMLLKGLAVDLAKKTGKSDKQVLRESGERVGIKFTSMDALSDEDVVKVGKDLRSQLKIRENSGEIAGEPAEQDLY